MMAKKNTIHVTDVRVHKVQAKKSKLKAFVTITLNEEFVVGGLKVIDGKDGLFVAMPSSKGSDGEYYDDCFPLNAELREEISKIVIEAYEEWVQIVKASMHRVD